MARTYYVPINLTQQELQNARLQNLPAPPSAPVTGQVYYDTSRVASYIWNGTAWVAADPSKSVGTIPNTALTTNPLARANHTGVQVSATISDLATVVQLYTLNQFAAPTANIPMAGYKFTGHATPTGPGDTAEYSWVIGQVQAAAAGIASKPPVRLVSTVNLPLSGLAAIDGVTPNAGDRVLVPAQTTASQNGVYNASAGSWTRTTVDGLAPGEIEAGALWLATEGAALAGTQWRVNSVGAITIGTTSISIVQFGAGSAYAAGSGIAFAGSAISVNAIAGGGVLVAPAGVSVDTSVVSRHFAATVGDGVALSFTLAHTLNTQDVIIQVRMATTPFSVVECDMAPTSTTSITVGFATAPATGAYRVSWSG